MTGARLATSQIRLRWSDSGAVTRLVAALYDTPGCGRLVHTQRVPNHLDSVAERTIHFSNAPDGAAKARSFSPTRVYYARIIAVSGPSGSGPRGRCTRLGRV